MPDAGPASAGLPATGQARPLPVRPAAGHQASDELLLEVREVSKRFGGLLAVNNVSFSVRRGEIVSIIGPNGAGKTSLFNLITGLYQPDHGSILFRGRATAGLPPHRLAALGMGRTFQGIRLFANMSALENVLVGAHGRLRAGLLGAVVRPPRTRREEQLAREEAASLLAYFSPDLAARREEPARNFPYAHQRRIELARALAMQPSLILLDEPAAGMNQQEAAELVDIIRQLRDSGYTIILVEHHMNLVMTISDRIIVLDHGEKIAEGTPAAIASDPRLVEAYLGSRSGHAGGDGAEVTVGRPSRAPSPAPAGPDFLALRGVSASYGAIRALREVNLTVRRNEIVCLLGANGAGKSTCLRSILGAVPAREGEIWFDGVRLDRMHTADIVKKGVAIVPEGRRVFSRLTVRENLELGAFTRPAAEVRATVEEVLAVFPHLKDRLGQKAGTLSGGEQQMLAIGRALMLRPQLLCLDEPSMGLAPRVVETLFEQIADIRRNGTTILMVEQNAHLALEIADRGYVMQNGSIALAGPARELLGSAAVQEAYLGSAP